MEKSIFINTLQGLQMVETVPIWELEFHGWNSFSTKEVLLGEKFVSLTNEEQNRALHQNTEIFLQVSQELHFSALTVPGGYWEIASGVPAYYWLPHEARIAQIKLLRENKPDDLALVANTGGVMAMPGASEYTQFCLDLYDHPEKIEQRAQLTLERGLEMARLMRDLGVEAVFTASDIADNHGVFFRPTLLRKFILPYLQKWATGVRDVGLKAILHSDGNLSSCLEEIATSGVQALQAIDPVAGMDMINAMEKVRNRIALCGNIDCGLLLTGKPDEVFSSTSSLLDRGKYQGRLVLGASNAVQPEVPKENYEAMISAWKEFGKISRDLSRL